MAIKVLGLCGSPINSGNTWTLLQTALESVEGEDVETEAVSLHGLEIADCEQCNWCMGRKQTPERWCKVSDAMSELYPKIDAADVLLLASPVYIGRMSGHLAAAIDRMRAIHYGTARPKGMKHKVGGAMAVAWYRHAGVETTLQSLIWTFLTFQMLIAVPGSPHTFGAGAVSSLGGTGDFDINDKLQVLKDELGLKGARSVARSAVELAKLVQRGRSEPAH
jgi:multimeric flavodoxin WrbA